jgi:hypothetical protein
MLFKPLKHAGFCVRPAVMASKELGILLTGVFIIIIIG